MAGRADLKLGDPGNPIKGEATFVYQGETFHLVLNNQAWIEAEEVLGYSILDMIEELKQALDAGKNPKVRHMAALLFGGLVRQHPGLSEDAVVDMIFSGDPAVKNGLLRAIAGAQPPELADTETEAGNAPAAGTTKPKKAGIGKRSS